MEIKRYCLGLPILLAAFVTTVGSAEWEPLTVPKHFSEQDISRYTVRYVSPSGRDSEDCLTSQQYNISGGCSPTAANDQPITYCKTVGYAMVGECLGQYAVNCTPDVTDNVMIVVIPGEVYGTDNRTTLQAANFTNIMLRGVCGCDKEIVVSCLNYSEDDFNDIYVQDTRGVAIDGLTFANCGPYSNGIAFRNVYDNVVSNSVFRNNLNSGIANYDPHNASFINCTFKDNYSIQKYSESVELNVGQYRYAGGLNLLWRGQSIKQVNILIKNCIFINNTAGVNQANLDDTRPNLYIPRGHGGAILAAFNGTQNHNITIIDTLIKDNFARFNGGGMFLSFYAGSNNNSIEIRNSRFESNSCNKTGGGISMYTFEVANENILKIENTIFLKNKASLGGGACTINLQDNQISVMSNTRVLVENVGVFESCTFEDNSSPAGGSAVGLVTNTRVDQVIRTTNFSNCKFINNKAREDSEGALMAFRFPISLLGEGIFKGNRGGGATLLQSHLNNHGSVLFEGNYAVDGGGLEMRDASFIQVFQNSSMTFINNSATNRGGALSRSSASSVAIDSDVIRLFNTRCFIQYDLKNFPSSYPPEYWNISMKFINNTAGVDGGAVYSTDIQSCLYTRTLSETPILFKYSIFQLTQFSFINNSVAMNSVARVNDDFGTAPTWLKIEPDNVVAAPGEILAFDISALDGIGNWKEAVWNYVENYEGSKANNSDSFLSLKVGGEQHKYQVKGLGPNENCSSDISRVITFSLVRIIAGSVSNQTNVTINVTCCYPGYSLDEQGACELQRKEPILRGDDYNHYVYIRPQFYAEYDDTTDTFIHAIIPIPFHRCNTRQSSLTGCLIKYDKPYEQCRENRTGFLCGECPAGQGVDLTLRQCRDCNIRDTILVIVIIILFGFTCALILVFNVRIPNELRGTLFFIQVVGFVYRYTNGEKPSWDFHVSRLFGTSLYVTLCPLPGTKALYTASYGLILPALGIIIIIAYVTSAKFIRHLSNKNSLDGIWFLSFIIYKFIADTSFIILRCQKVVGSNRFVFYYDGSNECFTTSDPEHLGFAVLALILGFLVILFPGLILLISLRRLNISPQFTDVLNKNLKVSCRWWGSFDIFRRLLFFIIVLILNYVAPSYSQLALFYAGIAVFFVFACSKPYISMTANIMEAVVLLDLIILTGIFLDTSQSSLNAIRPFANILLLLPFLTIFLYYINNTCTYSWNRWCPHEVKDHCKKWRQRMKDKLAILLPSFEHNRHIEDSFKTELLVTSQSSIGSEVDSSTVKMTDGTEHPGYVEFREELLG